MALVWLIGAAAGSTPDFPAHVFVVPTAIVLGFLIWPAVWTLDRNQLTLIASAALVALLIHLLAAGGWTVPGVAIHVWLLAAVITSLESRRGGLAGRTVAGWSLAVVLIGVLLLGTFRTMSLIPVQTAQIAMKTFEFAEQRGRSRQAARHWIRPSRRIHGPRPPRFGEQTCFAGNWFAKATRISYAMPGSGT